MVLLVVGSCTSDGTSTKPTSTTAPPPVVQSLIVAAGGVLAVVDTSFTEPGKALPTPRRLTPTEANGGGPHGQICENPNGGEFAVATNGPTEAPAWTIYSWSGRNDATLAVEPRVTLATTLRGGEDGIGCAFLDDHRLVTTTASRTDPNAPGRVLQWQVPTSTRAAAPVCTIDATVTAPRQVTLNDQGVIIVASEFGATAGLWQYGTRPDSARSVDGTAEGPCPGPTGTSARTPVPTPPGFPIPAPFGVQALRDQLAVTSPTTTNAVRFVPGGAEVDGIVDRSSGATIDDPHRSVAGTPTALAFTAYGTYFTDTDLQHVGSGYAPGPNGTVRVGTYVESTPTGSRVLAAGLDNPTGLAVIDLRRGNETAAT